MAVNTVVEEVAENLEEMAEVTRRINTRSIGFFLGGAVVGLGVGFYLGYRWNKEKIKAEAFEQSEEEVSKIREEYQRKIVASIPKPSVEKVIEEKGYDRPLPPPVPVREPVSAPPVVIYDGGKDKNRDWDMEAELNHRVEHPDDPYVLHQDEFNARETGYRQVVYTYYAYDDILYDQEDGVVVDGNEVVGFNNFQFGHGTDDIDVVFVRNNKHKLEMEIVRRAESYEEVVLGVENSELDDQDDED